MVLGMVCSGARATPSTTYWTPATEDIQSYGVLHIDGDKKNTGAMVARDHGFMPAKAADGSEYNRVVLAADYASGDNAIGGGGADVYYFFTKDISLLTGPIWFNDSDINGKWKWTVQLDINASLLGK